jgi:hypothetical protein
LPVFFYLSCNNARNPLPEQNKKDSGRATKYGYLKKPGSTFPDTVSIRGKSAVFFMPDSLQMEKIRSVNDKMAFESMQHDCYFQMKYAREMIQRYSKDIFIRDVSKARWILFVKEHEGQKLIDLDAIHDMCGVILFDGMKDPIRIPMTTIETGLGIYFKKTN